MHISYVNVNLLSLFTIPRSGSDGGRILTHLERYTPSVLPCPRVNLKNRKRKLRSMDTPGSGWMLAVG